MAKTASDIPATPPLPGDIWHCSFPSIDYSRLEPYQQSYMLMEMYKVYVTTSTDIAHRRMRANSFFLSLNTAAVAGLGTIFLFFVTEHAQYMSAVVAIGCCIGAFMSYVWRQTLKHYRNVGRTKYDIIREIESRLPVAPLVKAELMLLGPRYAYKPLADIEARVPTAMFFVYLACGTAAVMWQHGVLLSGLVDAVQRLVAGG